MFDKHKNNIVVLLTLGKLKKYCHFANFGQVEKIIVLLTLSKSHE